MSSKKICNVCNKAKDTGEFYEARSTCKACYTKQVRFKSSIDYVEALPEVPLKLNGWYVVTSVLPDTRVFKPCLDALEKITKDIEGKLVILGMKPHQKPLKDEELYYPTNIPCLYRSFKGFDGSIIADLRVNPQSINPLTGLDRFPASVIVASPKLSLKIVPSSSPRRYRFLASTGTISYPKYRETERVGLIAKQAHTFGAVVVRVVSGHVVEVYPIEFAEDGSTYFKGIKYSNGSNADDDDFSTLVLGDLHLNPREGSWQREETKKVLQNILAFYKDRTPINKLVLHDILSFNSVSHHTVNQPFTKPTHTVEEEIEGFVKFCKLLDKSIKIRLVPSNHDNHLWKYIQEGRFLKGDAVNIDVCLSILEYRQYRNPVLSYIMNSVFGYDINIETYPTDNYSSLTDLSYHGDSFDYGAKGSIEKFAKLNKPMVIGHSHRIGVCGKVWQTGVCMAFQGYEGSNIHSAVEASVLVHSNDVREIVYHSNFFGESEV